MGGPFDQKYTPEQKEAMLWATLDRDPPLTVPDACKAARRGDLREELEAFDPAEGSVYSWRAKAQQRRRKLPKQDTPAAEHYRLIARILEGQLRDEEAKGKGADSKRLVFLSRSLDEIQAKLQGAAPEEGDEGGESEASRLARRLMKQANGNGGGELLSVGVGQSSVDARTSSTSSPPSEASN